MLSSKTPANRTPKPFSAKKSNLPPLLKQGIQLIQEGKLEFAVEQLQSAVRMFPNEPLAHVQLGIALARLRRFAEAETSFREAVRLQPQSGSIYLNLGASCLDQNKFSEAEAAFREGIKHDPKRMDLYRQLAIALEKQDQLEAAAEAIRQAIQIEPNDAETHARLGKMLVQQELPKEAEPCFLEATRLRPDNATYWRLLGESREAQSNSGQAESAFRTALSLEPGNPILLNNLAASIAGQNRLAEAEAFYRQAVELSPTLAVLHNNLGHNLRMQGRLDEAEASLREAIRLKADYPEPHNNLGIAYNQERRVAEALACYEEAIRLKPEYPEARLNRALCWLTAGDLEQGWQEYEWRHWLKKREPDWPVPLWDGSPLNGRTLLLQTEQGLGDTIQFIRYAPRIPRGSGGTVVLDCQPSLVELTRTCRGVDRVVPRGQPLPAADVIAPLLSLPGLIGTTLATIPGNVPYLTPDPTRVQHWRAEMAKIPGKKVGIVWQGSLDHKGDRARSVPVTLFQPLASIHGIQLCSLQKGPGSEQLKDASAAGMNIIDLGSQTNASFADTAALMKTLDLVLAVDTSVAHVAGSLGVPTWVMLPFASDWRWLAEREDTPWYPTMRLFRQPERGNWEPVIRRIKRSLEHWPQRLRLSRARTS